MAWPSNLHDLLMQMLYPCVGISELIKLKHEKADDAQLQQHHPDAHIQYVRMNLLRTIVVGIVLRSNAQQLQDASNREEETDERHCTDRQQNECISIRCIAIADKTNARHTVAIHFAQCHNRNGQHKWQRPGDQMEIRCEFVDAIA